MTAKGVTQPRTWLPLLLILSVCGAISGNGLPTPYGDDALAKQALALQQSGDYEGAVHAYRELLKSQPNDLVAHSNLGVVLVKLGHYDEAIAEYQEADRLAPGDPRIGFNLALAYSKSGRVREAASKLEAVQQGAPQVPQVVRLLADCELRLGNNDRVIALLQPLEAGSPDDLSIAYMLGVALIREKRVEEGQVRLEKIMRNGDSAETRFLLGMQMFESGDYPAAVKQLASAVELNPKVPELESFYGRALLSTGDPEGAIPAFHAELAEDPNNYDANLELGQIYTVRRKYEAAQPLLRRALLVRPQSTEAMVAMGEYLLAVNKASEARMPLEEAVKFAPNSPRAHRSLAEAYAMLGLPKDAARQRALAEALKTPEGEALSPKVNDVAPEFTLPAPTGDETLTLGQLRSKAPVVLVFGSYSCPNFRFSADALNALYRKYGKQVSFLLVYIREAHADDNWESTRNVREGVSVTAVSTMGQKQDRAMMCSRKLHLPFPAVVDGMDSAVEKSYHAWPSRALVVGTDGRVLYTSGLSELDFRVDEMERVLVKAIGKKN